MGQNSVNMQCMQQRGLTMIFTEEGTMGHINCRLEETQSIFISECWLLLALLQVPGTEVEHKGKRGKWKCLKNGGSWSSLFSKKSGWIRLGLGRTTIFKCLCMCWYIYFIYIYKCLIVCVYLWVWEHLSMYVHVCIGVNNHILKMVLLELIKRLKRDYFGETSLKILWEQILLLGNLEFFSLQAENLTDKKPIQVSRWKHHLDFPEEYIFTPTSLPEKQKQQQPKKPTTPNAIKTPDKSTQRRYYRFLWNWDEYTDYRL